MVAMLISDWVIAERMMLAIMLAMVSGVLVFCCFRRLAKWCWFRCASSWVRIEVNCCSFLAFRNRLLLMLTILLGTVKVLMLGLSMIVSVRSLLFRGVEGMRR